MGIAGDSYTYYGSLLFEGPGKGGPHFNDISEIEKKILKLLYDQRVFRNHRISRNDFEERFSDVLYSRISGHKLSNLANEYGLDRHDLDSLGQMVFKPENGNLFVKFPREAFLKLSGDSTGVDLDFCKVLMKRFNNITPYFHMRLAESNMLWNQYPSITIHYEEREEYRNILSSQVGLNSHEMMFIYNIRGDIWMRFYDPDKKIIPEKNEKVAQALFKALGLTIRGDILEDRTLKGIEIDAKYETYFRFLYDPRFPSGISKSEYLKLIKTIN